MAKRPKFLPNPDREPGTPGRPQVKIDWDKVNSLLIAGCSGNQIAGYLGIQDATLYSHCQAEKGEMFSSYSRRFYEKGESILVAKQFEKASKGDNTMLVWLGKNRLKQMDEQPKPAQVIVNVNSNGLASGLDVSASSLSTKSDSSAE